MADVADLNPAFLPLLNAYTGALNKAGIGYRLDSGYRTPEQQSEIYARSNQGRSFAAAPPWRSFHNYGLAADVIPTNPADYARMHDLARQAGLYDAQGGLGFTSYDPPHVEMPGSLSNLINQYHLANWRPASMPAPATGGIAYTGPTAAPSRVGTATPDQSNPFTVPANAPAGMRNNNPLNIKWYKDAPYEGLVGPSANTDQGDPQMVFKTPEAGWNAAYSLLNKKYGSGMTTPNMIIAGQGGWTPGNKQAALNVAKSAGIGPDDDIGFSDPVKAQKFMRALVQQEQGGASSAYPDAMIKSAVYGTTLNAAGAPATPAGGPGAPAAPGQPAAPSGGLAGQLATALKPLTPGGKGAGGDSGQADEPQPMRLPQAPMAQAVGGPMMMGQGGQNVMGQRIAQNDLAQRGFSMQPQLASTYGALGATKPVVQPIMPGQATGMPGLPGTTLNSPSQLQMALMSGQISPYDMYANNPAFGSGFGST